jgi:predicted PurR-regulated permease PerM
MRLPAFRRSAEDPRVSAQQDSALLGPGTRVLLTVGGTMIVVAGLKAGAPLLRPFVAALFLTVLSLPLLSFFKRLRCNNALAVALTMLALILVITGIGMLVGGSINEFTDSLPQYQAALELQVEKATTWLEERGVPAKQWISIETVRPGSVLEVVGTTVRRVAALLSGLTLVLITTLFLLAEVAGFPEKLEAAIGRRSETLERLSKMRWEIQHYLIIKTMVSLGTGLVATTWCYFLSIDFPLLWGLLAFLLNYIPTLGSILAGIPPVLLALVSHGLGWAILVALGYIALNISLGTMVEPHLMGRRLGLSTLVVFLSLVFWGWLWGPLGMLLSVPLTMILKIMLENTPHLRWIAILLDAGPRRRGPSVAEAGGQAPARPP